jgi:HD-like signal output (HDOD) protein
MTNNYYAVFIDDDELMLKAIKRTSRRLIPNWDVTFINQPLNWQAAIRQHAYPDIVFCDYRMPGINGADLLQQLAQQYPLSIRVLMTGDTRDEILLGNSGNAHSLLNKPFSDEHLGELLSHVEKLRALPITHAQQECLGQLSQLPVLPEIIEKLRTALSDEQTNASQIAEIIIEEPLIGARIMQVANSAYLGFHRTTDTLEEAISRLGTQLLYALTISFVLESETAHLMPTALHQQVCKSTRQMAASGKALAIALECPPRCREQVFTASVLNGTGRLVLAMVNENAPELAAQLRKASSHPDILITVFLLTLWCFPEEVIAPLLNIQNAPSEDHKAWINVLYYAHQYMSVKDDDQRLADFTSSLPDEVKTALLSA